MHGTQIVSNIATPAPFEHLTTVTKLLGGWRFLAQQMSCFHLEVVGSELTDLAHKKEGNGLAEVIASHHLKSRDLDPQKP